MSKATILTRLSKQGCLVCSGILWLAGLSFGQATISLSPTSAPPTTSTRVSGSGFSPDATVDIYFDTTKEASAMTDGSGSFSNISIPVPGSALPGEHRIGALQTSNGDRVQAQFDVNTNWSQFHFSYPAGRVPAVNRVNPYENVLSTSTVSGLKLKWSFATGAAVFSSPAVANGVVYVGSEDGNVYALNASTGAKLWAFDTHVSVGSSPVVSNGVVYVGSDRLFALDASTGAKLWSFAAPLDVDSSPAVVNGVVYTGWDNGNVYALDASTGAKLWSFVTRAGYEVLSPPAVVNGVVYVGSGDGNVYALNASTGTKLWQVFAGIVDSSPGVADGVVYVSSANRNVYALNASTGAPLWGFATGNSVESSPAVANGVVYFGSYDNNVYALNASTGAKLWSFATGNFVFASPVVANGVVYIGSEDGNVYAFGLTGSNGPVRGPQP
jgi:outer membrane protein assembly factor BamB